MRKQLNAVLIVLLIMISTVDVSATPGNLKYKSAKIIQCNGTYYGHHGADDHWHEGNENDNGSWSAIGPNLGYDNPCGGATASPATTPNAPVEQLPFVAPQESEADRNARIEADRIAEEKRLEAARIVEEERLEAERKAEKERIEAERKAEEERIRLEKKEAARIKKEKEDAELKLAQESSIEYSDVVIGDYSYNVNTLNNTKTFIVHQAVAPLVVNFKESVAKYEYDETDKLDYFEYGNANLKMSSYNDVNSDKKQLSILRLPTLDDVKESNDFEIEINGQTYNYLEYGFQLTYNTFTDLDSNDIKFMYNGEEIPIDYKIKFEETDDQQKKYVVTFENFDEEYDFPFLVSRRPLHSAMMYSSAGLGLFATAFMFLKKR